MASRRISRPSPSCSCIAATSRATSTREPSFFYPELGRPAPSSSLSDRRATVAAIFTDPRNGRMPRTAVNRIWTRLLGHGIVPNSDEMDGKPWSPAVLDWLASDFVAHKYDVKHLIATIMTSRAYQMPAVARTAEAPARNYAFRGPELRRLTAEQFADAIGTITGEWSMFERPAPGAREARDDHGSGEPERHRQRVRRARDGTRTARNAGYYVREYRNSSSQLTRALGRPIRDQVTSVRATEATTLQSLELVNGEMLTAWLMRGARRMTGQLADGSAQPVQRLGRRPQHPGADVRGRRLWRVEAVADHLGHGLQRAGTRAAGAGERGVRRVRTEPCRCRR